MNKFAATGLIYSASAGNSILVISHDHRQVRKDMRFFDTFLLDPGVKARRAHGMESIEIESAGIIRFRSAKANLRGMSADFVFVQDDEDITEDMHIIGQIVRA